MSRQELSVLLKLTPLSRIQAARIFLLYPTSFFPVSLKATAIAMAESAHDSQKEMLSDALHRARNAVFFDYRGYYKDAARAYGETCALLAQVMRMTLESEDRNKVEAIVSRVRRTKFARL